MKTKNNKLMKLLIAVGLVLGITSIYSTMGIYGTANAESDQLVYVNLQAPIYGAILLPHYQFALSINNKPTGKTYNFIYKCIHSTAGTPPRPGNINTSGTATLRGPGTMAKDGYVFVGWRNGNHVFQPRQVFHFTGDASLYYFYAMWAPAVVLSLDANGGTSAIGSVTRGANTQMRALPQPPTKAGYVFLGWFNTPEATGGSRLTAFTTVPSANTTYWARWGTPLDITIYYELMVNRDTSDARNQAEIIIGEIKHLFQTRFGVDLAPQSATRYEPALNQAGNSASDILDVNPSSHATITFRIVDIPLNEGRIAGLARPVRGLEGTTNMHLGDMIVTTQLAPAMLRRAVVHEISHILGAQDCTNFGCVMDISRHHTIHNRWCAACQSDIFNYLCNRRRNNPRLGW
ncbi:MAG: InlB B-repeat-containing protein [Defluviitaleaceae bacterium]|nr:InlB B-repeat-containing protein [Defluviitaleaceae bacterium]